MAYTPKVLYPTGYPSTSGTVLYTVPSGSSVIVKNIVLTNTTANETTISLHVVPGSGSAATSNAILYNFAISGRGVSTLDCSIVMTGDFFLYGVNGTNNAITATISGVEIA